LQQTLNDRETEPQAQSTLWRIITFPTTRAGRWVTLLFWVVLLAVASPLASRLSDVQDNDVVTWLPDSAESLQVARLQDQFNAGDASTAIIVYQRDGGLTEEDFATIEADAQEITEAFPDNQQSPVIPSEDGQVAILNVQFQLQDDNTSDLVDQLRDIVRSEPDGLQVKVTGPAGFAADLSGVFSGLNSTLLIATAAVVAFLLLITYRSPVLWILPLITVAFADQLAAAVVYLLVRFGDLVVNGQSGGVLPVLVFGVGTDYALLLLARYREELRHHPEHRDALRVAVRQAGPAILASAATNVLGLLTLLAADLNSNQSLGPVGATGILAALFGMLTLLVAILALIGRRVFWPFVPMVGAATDQDEENNFWGRMGRKIMANPRRVWITTVLFLGIMSLGLLRIDTTLSEEESFRNNPESIEGIALLGESFPAGATAPTIVIAETAQADAVEQAILQTGGVANANRTGEFESLIRWNVTIDAEPGSNQAFDIIDDLRDSVHAVPNANALVGGSDADDRDVVAANARDRQVVIPAVLIVVFVILCWLLRSLVAPLLLTITNVLSFAAALGASVLVFDFIFGFGGMDPSLPLLGFVFLVVLGIDYNIFLMSRVHQEAQEIGTRRGMLKGFAVTGGVITSAGIVLAATFAVLGVLPLVVMAELGFLVAFGVLVDTLIVRSVVVPALTFDIGKKIWWPGKLAKGKD
jgi:RND superfamily putative drug exporter